MIKTRNGQLGKASAHGFLMASPYNRSDGKPRLANNRLAVFYVDDERLHPEASCADLDASAHLKVTTLARAQSAPITWDEWVGAVVLPCACIIADYATGEYIFRVAPAALVSLTALGIAAFALSRRPDAGTAGLIAIGPIWLCGAVAAIVGFALTILVCIGVLLSIPVMPLFGLHMWSLFPLAVLATTPVCTAAIYLMRGGALARTLAAAHGTARTVAVAFAGALIAGAIVLAADFLDRGWVDARIDALHKASPEIWPATLASLNTYPLCGRQRCKQRVCSQLFRQFGQTPAGGLVTIPDVPAQHDAAFKQAYGDSIRNACRRYD